MLLFLDFDGVLHPFGSRHDPARQNEALAFMEATGQRWRWTALDDMPELWRSAIIACPDGFGAAQAERLRRWYEGRS